MYVKQSRNNARNRVEMLDRTADEHDVQRLTVFTAVVALALAAGFGVRTQSSRGGACSPDRPPLSEKISEVVASNSVTARLYAVTANGVVYVADGGSSWRKVPTRLPGWGIFSLGRAKDVLFSGYSPGLFTSEDRGGSWRSLACDWIVTDIAGSPSDPRTVYVATSPPEGGGSGGGLYRTTDQGKTWKRFTAIPRVDSYDLSVNVVAVKPGEPRQVYIAMESGGVVSSSDAGEHWRFNKIDHEDATGNLPQVTSLAFGPGPKAALWAGTRFKGVFRSDASAKHWTPRGLRGQYVDLVVADQRRANVLFAVVESRNPLRRTVDGGLHWQTVSGLTRSAYGIAVQSRDDSTYAWNARTVFRSRDHGATWKALAPFPR